MGAAAQPLRKKKAEKLHKKRVRWIVMFCEISLGLSKVEKFLDLNPILNTT